MIRGQGRFGIVNGFTALERVGGDLVLESNPTLRFLEGFDQLTAVDGDLRVTGNAALEVDEAFDLLDRVGGDLVVYGNPALESLSGLASVRAAGSVEIAASLALTELVLPRLADVPGPVRIADLPALTRLEGVPATSVGGLTLAGLRIGALRAFPQLTTIDGDALIERNSALVAWAPALDDVAVIRGDLTVRDNPLLPVPEVQLWADALQVDGEVHIEP